LHVRVWPHAGTEPKQRPSCSAFRATSNDSAVCHVHVHWQPDSEPVRGRATARHLKHGGASTHFE
jgi:hypothetical protein